MKPEKAGKSAEIIPFAQGMDSLIRRKLSEIRKTVEILAPPLDPDAEKDLMTLLFFHNDTELGFPEVMFHKDFWIFDDPRFGNVVLVDIGPPSKLVGLFCVEADSYRLIKLLDRKLVQNRY